MTPDDTPPAGADPPGPRRQRDVGPALDAAAWRAARRDFIRSQHPDVGGDPEAFTRGLAALEATGPPVARVPAVTTGYRRPRGVEALRLALTQLLERRRTPPPPPRVH